MLYPDFKKSKALFQLSKHGNSYNERYTYNVLIPSDGFISLWVTVKGCSAVISNNNITLCSQGHYIDNDAWSSDSSFVPVKKGEELNIILHSFWGSYKNAIVYIIWYPPKH